MLVLPARVLSYMITYAYGRSLMHIVQWRIFHKIVDCNGLFHLLKIHPHRRVTLGSPSRHQLILQKTLKTLIDFEDLPSRRIKVACDPLDINKFG